YLYITYLLFYMLYYLCFFFFQAEDGIRDRNVTGVQTCALPIFPSKERYSNIAAFPLKFVPNTRYQVFPIFNTFGSRKSKLAPSGFSEIIHCSGSKCRISRLLVIHCSSIVSGLSSNGP